MFAVSPVCSMDFRGESEMKVTDFYTRNGVLLSFSFNCSLMFHGEQQLDFFLFEYIFKFGKGT